MEDNDNLALKERSLEELIGHLSSDLQGDEYGELRFPQTSAPPAQHFGPEYPTENVDPGFLQRRNVYFPDTYQSFQKGSLPYAVNTPRPNMSGPADVPMRDYVIFGTPNPQRNQNVPNSHYFNKTNGTLSGFDYGMEYSGPDYNSLSGISLQKHGSAPQFSHNPEINAKVQLIENLVGNWTSDQSGTYSPFGTSLGGLGSDGIENLGLGIGSRKTRIVAEVRPMRPSYSDVLSKSITSNQNQNFKNLQDIKQRANDVKVKTPKYSIGRTLSGSGNLLNRQTCINQSNFINNSNLKGSNQKKIDCDNEGQENLLKKWLSLDDLKNAAKRESYISLNEVKSKKNSPKNLNFKANVSINKKEKWESTQLNNAKNLSAKPQAPKKQDKGNVKFHTRLKEKENVPGQKFERVRGKVTEERRAPVNQSKAEQPKTVKRNVRNCQLEKHRKTVKSKKKEQEPCISALLKTKMDCYIGMLWFVLNWFLQLVLDVIGLSIRLTIYMCAAIGTSLMIYSIHFCKKCYHSTRNIDIFKLLANCRFYLFNKPHTEKEETFDSDDESEDSGQEKVKKKIKKGLKRNISLPVTGEEAMKRLLACKGKDPYSILGVTHDCTDDDIKKYYKRQAFLVHPDKNNQPGAEEAFKILVHAFDLIGEPEHRKSYDRRMERTQVEQAVWSELSNLLSQLHKKMEYVANTIRCTNCNKRHKRTLVDRRIYAARMCNQCKIHHAVREGDIWAETSLFGLVWRYYACMDGAVYDITEWAGCQGGNLRNLKANTHNVQYRIILGRQNGQKQKYQHSTPSESDFEDFLSSLYTKSDLGAGCAEGDEMPSKKRKAKKRK